MNEIIERAETAPVTQQRQVAATPAYLLQVAVERGADLAYVEKLMELQERFEANEARKAFAVAFAAFKSEAVKIIKNRTVEQGPLRGGKYAELFAVVNAATPALSQHGLSTSWKLTKDEKDWLEVTCTLKHEGGHSETVSMGGPPDTGGAKSAVQARASTTTYLSRYTLKAILGLAEQGEDDDGGHEDKGSDRAMSDLLEDLTEGVIRTTTDAEALAYWKANNGKLAKALKLHAEFKATVAKHRQSLAEGAPA